MKSPVFRKSSLVLLVLCAVAFGVAFPAKAQVSQKVSYGISMQDGEVRLIVLRYRDQARSITRASEMTEEERNLFPNIYFQLMNVEQPSGPIVAQALDLLKEHAPFAYWIYAQGNAKTFRFFLNPSALDDPSPSIDSIAAGIHETAHTIPNHALPLIDQTFLRVPDFDGPARGLALGGLSEAEARDSYALLYLDGLPGLQGFQVLLDELNAYACEAQTTVSLAQALHGRQSVNPGMLRMMRYVSAYWKQVRQEAPDAYKAALKNAPMKSAVLKLWRQAERVLQAACESEFASFKPDESLSAPYADTQALSGLFGGAEKFSLPKACAPAQ